MESHISKCLFEHCTIYRLPSMAGSSATMEAGASELNQYLKRREEDLLKFHPQFFFTDEEIAESDCLLKRDYSPICIPPSWDLVQKYAGALDKNADGFDKELYEKGRRNYVGDQGEAEFLDWIRNSNIGGILIGDVNPQHLLYGQELSNSDKDFILPNQIVKSLKKAKDFQFDFLYFNSQIGLIHIEVKKDQKPTMEKVFGYSYQIRNQRRKLQEVFKIFCENIGEQNTQALWFEFFNAPSILMQLTDSKVAKITIKSKHCRLLNDIAEFAQFLNKQQTDRNRKKITTNFFEKKIFRQFIIFLSGYRPNFFISPVKCALEVHKNIFTHHINTVNYYSKNKKDILQNIAKTTKEFLQELKFVKNTDIKFGEYSKIYLTTEQMEAIGKFDGEGNFSPRLQLIHGPPGSGKSLILMIKMFICGQMEQRKDRPIIYSSTPGDDFDGVRVHCHEQKLAAFIKNNRSAFYRKFSYRRIRHIEDMNVLNDDYFVDEHFGLVSLRDSALLKDSEQMITMIYTGVYGETFGSNHYLRSGKPYLGIECVTELHTVFRSSRQIQRYFFERRDWEASISLDSLSGHNYDGVKVETHDFPNFESGLRFVEERLMKLVRIEGCRETDIGLVYWSVIDGKDQTSEQIKQIKQIERRIRQRFTNISVFDYHLHVPSLEFPVMLIVEEPSDSRRRFLMASRAICHLIVCNVIEAHVKRSVKLML